MHQIVFIIMPILSLPRYSHNLCTCISLLLPLSHFANTLVQPCQLHNGKELSSL